MFHKRQQLVQSCYLVEHVPLLLLSLLLDFDLNLLSELLHFAQLSDFLKTFFGHLLFDQFLTNLQEINKILN